MKIIATYTPRSYYSGGDDTPRRVVIIKVFEDGAVFIDNGDLKVW